MRVAAARTTFRIALLALLVATVGAGLAIGADSGSSTDSGSAGSIDPAERIQRMLEQDDVASLTKLYPPPKVTAKGWLVYDSGVGEPIAGLDAGTPRPIASLTKLMTALVVVERLDLGETVTIPASVNDLPADASRMDARAGEKWKAADLLKATLVYSANDAALALASHVGDGSEARFVELMNEKADDLGLVDTRFESSTGLDLMGTASTSTPIDLVTLADTALREDPIREAVATKVLKLTRPGGTALDPLPNRNPLLGKYDGVDGVKTGFTDAAGYMLVVHQLDEKTGGALLVATFASKDEQSRSSDAAALLDWARPLRQDLVFVEGGTELGTVPVQRSDEHVKVFACDDLRFSARVGERIVQEAVLPRSVAAPVQAGDEIGELRVHAAGIETDTGDDGGGGSVDDTATPVEATVGVGTVPICAGTDVPKLGTWDRIVNRARDWRSAWKLGADEVDDAWSSVTG
ncbi:MAG: D-alanyl-D-alanine carboxypeptidase [Thermoleophilia bacterium]|nr:D-alanyl-D-alanine carboxypeptidase [Thermoleophilia bacterium]